MDHYQKVMVALSESVSQNRIKHPLGDKSRWCPILLAIKPRYLKNHASQIKSYYTTLSGSRGRSFRICLKKSPKVLFSREITMTSYSVGNKTSLSWKPCIAHKSNYGSHARSFRIRHEKSPEAPLAEDWRWRHIRLAIEHRYLENHASQIKSYYWALSWSFGRLVICIKKQ